MDSIFTPADKIPKEYFSPISKEEADEDERIKKEQKAEQDAAGGWKAETDEDRYRN